MDKLRKLLISMIVYACTHDDMKSLRISVDKIVHDLRTSKLHLAGWCLRVISQKKIEKVE